MAAPSPNMQNTSLVTFTIKVNGAPINGAYQVVSVNVIRELNQIPSATIMIRDGSAAAANFPISESSDFIPGNKITISAGYNSNESVIFSGIIMQQGLSIDMEDSLLSVICSDAAIKMTVGKKNMYFNNGDSPVKDSELITKLIGNYSGLSAKVSATTVSHPLIYQYYSSDWDFIVTRAEANGMIVSVVDGTVNINPPSVSGSPVLSVTYGDSLIEMDSNLDSTYQFSAVEAVSWDPAQQKIIKTNGSKPPVNSEGNITSTTLASVVGLKDFGLQSSAQLAEDELKAWAEGQQLKSWMSRLNGRIRFQGSALALPDKLIELGGVGTRFNGNIYLKSIHHIIEGGNWFTEVMLGMDENWFSETRQITASPAQGLMPGVRGLQVGKVKQTWKDPQGLFRVQITLPLMQNDAQAIWARMATLYASNETGTYFYPEIGDEVVVGFFDDDPRGPVILGLLYSSKNKAPYQPDEENTFKAIVSKSKIKLEINDKDKILTLTTPGNNKAVLDDKAKSITISDQNGNKIVMDSSGISIKSAKDVNIEATGSVNIKANQNIQMTASGGDVKASGLNVDMKANMKFSASGNAGAELTSSLQTVVKGTIVMIN